MSSSVEKLVESAPPPANVEEGRGDETFNLRPASSSSSSSSIAPEDLFEEATLRHMKKTGFLSDLKGLVAKYIVDITKQNGDKCHVIPERVDEVILSEIGNYLQWVGMKNSLAVLLSESPIPLHCRGTEDEDVPKMVAFFQHFEQLKKVLEEAEGSSVLIADKSNVSDDKEDLIVIDGNGNNEEPKQMKNAEESPSKAADLSEDGISDLLSSTVEDLTSLKGNDTQDISFSDSEAKGMTNADHAEDL